MSKYVLLSLLLAGCGGSGSDDATTVDPAKQKAVLADFGAKVVIPTYENFAAHAAELGTAIAAFDGARDQAHLDAVRAAWVATRTPWEQSEAFVGYGPAKDGGFDAAVDSWPVNHADLQQVLASANALTSADVAKLDDTLRGFHTVEFLIYGETSDKAPAAFTDRELVYLKATDDALTAVANALVAGWKTGNDGRSPYAQVIATAGDAGNSVFSSLGTGLQQVVEGMVGICNEVANSKIAKPLDAQDPNQVESQFSFNSLLDFADNIRSVQHVYLGQTPSADGKGVAATGASVSSLVAAADPTLDKTVRTQIDAAIAAILAVPPPFPKTLLDPAQKATINAAQEAIRTLQDTLKQKVEPLVAR